MKNRLDTFLTIVTVVLLTFVAFLTLDFSPFDVHLRYSDDFQRVPYIEQDLEERFAEVVKEFIERENPNYEVVVNVDMDIQVTDVTGQGGE